MGKRGPPPTPSKILQLRGSWRGKRNPGEPQPDAGRPSCPRSLSPDERKVWRKLIPMLDRMGVLTLIDGFALERYCQKFVEWRLHVAFLRDKGLKYATKNAEGLLVALKAYPEAKRSSDLEGELLRIEQQFGLTPAARSRLHATQPDQKPNTEKSRFFGAG